MPEEAEPAVPPPQSNVDRSPSHQRWNSTSRPSGYVDNGEHFVTLLSQADKVTIVGLTNESLASMLRTALDRKREAIFRPQSWSQSGSCS